MISFEPSEDQALMVDSVAQFARTTLRPRAREFEALREIPDPVRRMAHELGLGMVALPEAIGGAGLGITTAVLLEEEIGWGDAAAGFAFAGPGAFGFAIQELASVERARAVLAPFTASDGHTRFGAVAWGERTPNRERPGFTTTATKIDAGYRLDGEKHYVVNADRADRYVVFAQVDASAGFHGIGAFLVERDAQGLSVLARDTTVGLDAVSFGGLRLDGVVVPASARLEAPGKPFEGAVVRFFARQALVVAARGVGLGRSAVEITRDYVDGRKAFGKPIGHFQAVAFTIADRAMDVDAGRALVLRAAAAWDAFDRGEGTEADCLRATAHAVAWSHESAMRCGDDGVQLHGGAGFMRDYLVEKLMRDAKQIGLCALTAEHADQLAAAVELELPTNLALVLPTPETQNAFV